ncbi:MAG: septum formation initiator family protein [Patescibacteria group bacterium]
MQGRKRNQTSWLWRAGLVLALIFAVLSITRTVFVFFQARTAFRETTAVDESIAGRKQEITELEERIAKLKSGEGLEMEARGRLNLQKPDEHVVVIVEDDKGQATTTDNTRRSWWKNMLGWVGVAW